MREPLVDAVVMSLIAENHAQTIHRRDVKYKTPNHVWILQNIIRTSPIRYK